MSRARSAGIAGTLVGAAAAGVAAGLAIERRAVRRVRTRPDPEAREPFGRLHTRGRTVLASDGVPIHVEEDGDLDAPLTIVFVHGFSLTMDCWHYQRRDLRDLGRLVFYDHRSHGASGRSPKEHATVDQLARDLYAVLQATAPRGPVVLVGHSMGGMTVMALADQRPELFGDRVVGVALIGTAPGRVYETVFGIPAVAGRLLQPITPSLLQWVDRRAALVERGRLPGSDLAYVLTRMYAFGSRDVSPSLVQFMERMVAGTAIEVMADFFPTFIEHDKLQALAVLDSVPTLVLCGSKDLLTPVRHSRDIAHAVPSAELVILSGAGHMVQLERPALVNLRLRSLVRRASELKAAESA